MYVLASSIFLDQRRASKVSCRWERIRAFVGILMDVSCGVWWVGGMALVNGDGFYRQLRGGSIVGGPSISAGLAQFFLGVDAWWIGSSRIQLIPRRRIVP